MKLLPPVPPEKDYNRLYKLIYKALKDRENDPQAEEKAKEAKRIVDYVYLLRPETFPNPPRK